MLSKSHLEGFYAELTRKALSSRERSCDCCGKRFYITTPDMWVYKRRILTTNTWVYHCSYHCFREVETTKKAPKQGERCEENRKKFNNKRRKKRSDEL